MVDSISPDTDFQRGGDDSDSLPGHVYSTRQRATPAEGCPQVCPG